VKKNNWISYLIFVVSSMYLVPSSAVPVLSFETSSNNVNVGASFEVDIVASVTSGEIISIFDLDVTYNSSVLNATDVSFGLGLGNKDTELFFSGSGTFEAEVDFILGSGRVDIAEISNLFDYQLQALQIDSFTLATITFKSLAEGDSYLLFDPVDAIVGGEFDLILGSPKDYNEDDIIADANSTPLVITNTVPEPSILFLMMIGLLGLRIVTRKKS